VASKTSSSGIAGPTLYSIPLMSKLLPTRETEGWSPAFQSQVVRNEPPRQPRAFSKSALGPNVARRVIPSQPGEILRGLAESRAGEYCD
jgi:hypothetical protein